MTSNIWLDLLSPLTHFHQTQFIQQTQQLETTQAQFLFKLLKHHRHTEIGQKFDFSTIQTLQDFRTRIPILSYNFYEPYIQRMMEGENNLLTPEPPIYFNFTSGTTAKQKIIPVTHRTRKIKEKTKLISIGFLRESARQFKIPLGLSLLTSSVQLFGHTNQGIPYGPVSVGDLHFSNPIQKNLFIQPYDALKITDIVSRNYICLLFALRNPHLSVIAANYPIIALILAEYLQKYAPDLIQDLKTGRFADWLNIEPELRQKLAQKWQANPLRAQQLEDILAQAGHLTPQLAWPSLGCIVTARGMPSNFYFQKFPQYFGQVPIFGGIYVAAEAVFGIYSQLNDDGSILAINSNFFEFIPEPEWDKENPQTLLPHQLEIGQQYRIVVTNYTGFYRYDIGDIIQVLGFYHQTPIITFLQRAKGVLTSTTEKTTDAQVMQAMQTLQKDFQLSLENFCVTLSSEGFPPPYVLNLELSPHRQLKDPQRFLKAFDSQLQTLNTCYQVERQSTVPAPILRILAPGSFAELSQRLVAKGMPESQVKILNLNPDRQYLQGLQIEQEVFLND